MRKKLEMQFGIVLFVCMLVLTSCASTNNKMAPAESLVKRINEKVFAGMVDKSSGNVLVLFYNDKFWQSRDLMKRYAHFAEKFEDYAHFYGFKWDIKKEGTRYNLDLLPTIVLYKDGIEIDRLRGIPADGKERMGFNDDLELWMLKNVVGLSAGKYVGDFRYRFNNSNRLHIGNY